MHFLCRLCDIQSMVADSLKVSDSVQHLGNRAVIRRGNTMLGNTNNIGVQLVLILV